MLITSRDAGVNHAARESLKKEGKQQRTKFQPYMHNCITGLCIGPWSIWEGSLKRCKEYGRKQHTESVPEAQSLT